jgi:tetratricopeptide (TPR) repeat protein
MSLERWPRVKELFHAALERAPVDRARFLGEACGPETSLRVEVERLLAAHEEAGSFIEASPVAGLARAATSATQTLAGRVLGHYEIQRLIGVGGMGEVYAAHDTELGRTVAVKVVREGTRQADGGLRHEARQASKLNHPHICTVHEVGTFEGQAYIVMEYVEGQPLNELTGAVPLPPGKVVRYGIQIADALAHAHRQGVIHRDLKTSNVVVTSDGRAKVLDFGLARGVLATRTGQDLQLTGPPAEESLAGTLPYMAPELFRGAVADQRTDVWALGVVLFEMAAGYRPFPMTTAAELRAAIPDTPPARLPPTVPAALDAVIRRCLAQDRHDRYQHASEVGAALEAVDVALDRPAPRIPATPGHLRRVRAVALAIAVVGLTLAAVAVWPRSKADAPPVALGASGRPTVAVMSFDNVGGAPETAWLSTGVPSMLLAGLAQSRGLEIVSAQRLQESVAQLGQDHRNALDRVEMARIARQAGAGAMLVGTIIKAGAEIRLDAQLEDLSTGRVLLAETARGTDLFALVDQLAARIRDGIGLQSAGDVRGVAAVTTASLEAYRLYALGAEARLNGRHQESLKLLEQAVAVDPTFADAYLELASVSGPLRRPAAAREYLRKAAALAHRLSERQRLLLQVQLARDDGQFLETERLLNQLVAAFPDLDRAYLVGFRLYLPVVGPLQDPEKLLAISRAGALALPASPRTRNLYGYALLSAGRFAEAVREFEAYAALAPREPGPFDSLGDAYLAMGDPPKAIESYSRAMAIDPSWPHNGRAWALAVAGRLDEAIADGPDKADLRGVILSRAGRYREARQAIAAGVTEAESAGNRPDAGALHLLSAALAIEQGDYAQTLRDVDAARSRFVSMPPELLRTNLVAADLLTGIAESRLGHVAKALSSLRSLSSAYVRSVDVENCWHSALEGEISLAAGDLPQAAAAFAAGQPSRPLESPTSVLISVILSGPSTRDGAARVASAQGDLTAAIDTYRQLLTLVPGQRWVAAFEPRYVLEIARLQMRAGHKDAARQEYRRFLELWKNADPGLPEVAEARRGL